MNPPLACAVLLLGAVPLACNKQDGPGELAGEGDKEVASSYIGERVMEQLRELDGVAYVRFASVYRSFRDVAEFMSELEHLLHAGKGRE